MKRIWLLLIAVGLGAGVAVLFFHPYFALRTVMITGLNFASPDEIQQVLDTYRGRNLFATRLVFRPHRKLVSTTPVFDDVVIESGFSRDLVLRAVEKTPQLSFLSPSGHILVSADGTILNRDHDGYVVPNLSELAVINGVDKAQFQNAHMSPDLLKSMVSVITLIRRHFSARHTQVEFIGPDSLLLMIDDTLPVYLGSLEDLETKFENLSSFFRFRNRYPDREVEYIDLRVTDRVVVRWEGS